MNEEITVAEFEAQVKEIEDIVVLIRAPRNSKIKSYTYTKKAAGNASINSFRETRLKPFIGEYEISIFDGNFAENPHGRTQLSKLRESYGADDSNSSLNE